MPGTSQPSNHRAGRQQGLEIPQGLCRHCVRTLSRRLRDLPGVVSFEIDAGAGRVWISGEVDPAAAQAAVDDLSCS
jgi:ribosomal protein S14